jgi:hypothetical protein
VGLWPWNPDKIFQNCQENCPVEAPLNESLLVRKLLRIIKSIDEEKERRIQRMLDEMKEEQVVSEKEVLEKTASERNLAIKLFGDWKKVRSQRLRKAKKKRIKELAERSCLPKRGRGRPRKNREEKKTSFPPKTFFCSQVPQEVTLLSQHLHTSIPVLFFSFRHHHT